jgi:hypothetical protein
MNDIFVHAMAELNLINVLKFYSFYSYISTAPVLTDF